MSSRGISRHNSAIPIQRLIANSDSSDRLSTPCPAWGPLETLVVRFFFTRLPTLFLLSVSILPWHKRQSIFLFSCFFSCDGKVIQWKNYTISTTKKRVRMTFCLVFGPPGVSSSGLQFASSDRSCPSSSGVRCPSTC